MARKHIEPLVKPHTGPVNPCGFSLMWWDFDQERIRLDTWAVTPGCATRQPKTCHSDNLTVTAHGGTK
jgi:hypothetical protein